VYISPAQTYQEVRELSKAVHRIEAGIDGVLNETRNLRDDVGDHETRIRALERARWPLPTIGVLAGVAGAATGAISLLAR
jgi:hypothetical protein